MSIFSFKKGKKIILNKEKKVDKKILEYNKKYNAPYGEKQMMMIAIWYYLGIIYLEQIIK